MARSISKSLASAKIYVLNPNKSIEFDENGAPIPNDSFEMDGNPSQKKAELTAYKKFGTKNIMVLRIDVDETKLTVNPDVFFVNASPCEDGKTYGREYVTQTFKSTSYKFITASGVKEGMYFGTTTFNKLLSYVRESEPNAILIPDSISVIDTRYYMTREKYMSLA